MMNGLRGRLLGAILGMALLTGAGVAATPSSAEATPWNPTVTLQGRAICGSVGATWVWVEASNGERGWATNGNGNYRFTFRRVPTSGMTVRVNYGNSSFRCRDSFGVNRPMFGTNATRNVIRVVPNA